MKLSVLYLYFNTHKKERNRMLIYLLRLLLNSITLCNAYEQFLMNDAYYALNDIKLDAVEIVKNKWLYLNNFKK